jgi:hypothetical protein
VTYLDSPFQRAMFEGGQRVYDRIVAGEHPDVEAELMDVHLNASEQADKPDR